MNLAANPDVVAAEIAYRFERDRVTTRPGLPARRTLRERLRGIRRGRPAPSTTTVPRSRHA